MINCFIAIVLCLFITILNSIPIYSQKYEYVYKNQSDSTVNCYLKVIPDLKPIKGLVIRDYSSLPDSKKKSPYKFTQLCADNGLMIVYTVTSKQFPEFFISDSIISVLDTIVAEVIKDYNIPLNNIFIGGISSSGTRALRYAQYCEQGKSKFGIRIKGVFSVDSPLDLARFYESAHNHRNNFKDGMLWEANLMKKVFKELFKGPPKEYESEYRLGSVFSHIDSLGGNTIFLKQTNIILYHEPDIDWWLQERGSSYYDINSYDIAAFYLKLTMLGNNNIELKTTSNKGFDENGKRKCHSWTIVDEKYLTNWIVKQLE